MNRVEFTTSDASLNLVDLYKALPYMQPEHFEKARVAYENNGWKKKEQEFK